MSSIHTKHPDELRRVQDIERYKVRGSETQRQHQLNVCDRRFYKVLEPKTSALINLFLSNVGDCRSPSRLSD